MISSRKDFLLLLGLFDFTSQTLIADPLKGTYRNRYLIKTKSKPQPYKK